MLADTRQLIDSTEHGHDRAHAQLIYETDTHQLWYDSDGTGGAAPVEVALRGRPRGTLRARDFLVVPDI